MEIFELDDGARSDEYSQLPYVDDCRAPTGWRRSARRHPLSILVSGILMACFSSWALGIWTSRVFMTDSDYLRRISMNCKSNLEPRGLYLGSFHS